MEEAVEICKLRLFLKLVSQVAANDQKPNYGLEPLPDIDFNIRAGNTLVGFATYDEVKKAVEGNGQQKLDLFSDMPRIDESAEIADRAFQQFRLQQTEYDMDAAKFKDAKIDVRRRLKELNDELNQYLASEYGVNAKKALPFDKWLKSHQPFHWFVEFYRVIKDGGFDVIVGNPPYVEYRTVKNEYKITGYETLPCGNLYAYVLERCLTISNPRTSLGVIIPLGAFSTKRMLPLLDITKSDASNWISSFGVRPAKLFEGVNWRLSVLISRRRSKNEESLFTTKHMRWYSEERIFLFSNFQYYCALENKKLPGFPKYSSFDAESILRKIYQPDDESFTISSTSRKTENFVNYQEATQYWIKAMNRLPFYEKNGVLSPPAHGRTIYFSQENDAYIACLVMNIGLTH